MRGANHSGAASNAPPAKLDGARVLSFAALNGIRCSGKAVMLMNGAPIALPTALGVRQYVGESDIHVLNWPKTGQYSVRRTSSC